MPQRLGTSDLISLWVSVFHNITYLVNCWKDNELVAVLKESGVAPGTRGFLS